MNNAYSMEHRELTPSPFAFTAIREPFCATVQARGPPFYEGVARFRTFPLVKYRTLVLKPPIENGSVRLDWIERNPPLTFYCTPAFSYRFSYLLKVARTIFTKRPFLRRRSTTTRHETFRSSRKEIVAGKGKIRGAINLEYALTRIGVERSIDR